MFYSFCSSMLILIVSIIVLSLRYREEEEGEKRLFYIKELSPFI